jgi:hypothetical protein
MGLLDLGEGIVVLLVMVLVISIVVGSFLMAGVSLLLLAVFGALAYRAWTIKRNFD